MIGQLLQLLQLGIAAFVGASLAVELARRPVVLVYGLLGVHFWEAVAAVPHVQIAGIGLSPIDAVNMVVLGGAAIRLRRPRGQQWALIGFTALVLFAVSRALVTFGTGEAMLGFRAELYYIGPALLASTFRPNHIAPTVTAVWRFGLCMGIVAAARWLLLAFGIDAGSAPNAEGYAVARVINAAATMAVAIAAVLGVWRWLNAKPTRWHLPWTLLGMLMVVIFAQHRSVWVATAVMLLIVFAATPGRIWLRSGIVIALGGLVVLIEATGLGDSGVAADSLAYAASNVGTWEWRLERWQDVWATHADRGLGAILFGSGYGYSWVSGTVGEWEASPHNGFLQIAVRTGLLGAALLFGTYMAVLRRPIWGERTMSKALKVATAGVLVYFIPYSGNALSGLLLGVTVAWFARSAGETAVPTPDARWKPSLGSEVRAPR